ncbi:MAG: hypothetical protein SOH93_01855 [Oscillospiraceae bacterium]|jgi:hypothetical protein
MNQSERKTLIQCAVKLVRLGREPERERNNLREIVKQGYPCDSIRVNETCHSFLSLRQK